MGNLCCHKTTTNYDELVISESTSRLDLTTSVENQREPADVTDITAYVSAPVNSECQQENLSYISHPYICDEDVVRHLLLQKTMFIMRGVPGSGKSTLVRELQKRFPKAVVCSADMFWITPEGEYAFDVRRLKEAHEWCRNMAYQSCETGKGHIIIDNTNVKRWEFKYYSDIATRFDYLVMFVEPQTPWRFDADILFSKGTHDVPMHALQAKIKGFEKTPVPLFFGWFANQITLESLMKIARSCLGALDAKLRSRIGFPDDADPVAWFRFKTELHVTSLFCDRGRAPGATEYAHEVQSQIGRLFSFRAASVLVTTRTMSAVTPLTDDKRPLWRNGDDAQVHCTLGTAAGVAAKTSGEDVLAFAQAKNTRRWSIDHSDFDVLLTDDQRLGALFQFRRPLEFSAIFNGRY